MQKKSIAIVILVALLAAIILFFNSGKNEVDDPLQMSSEELLKGNAFQRPYSPIVGPVDAPVTLVEFFDPSCEACRAFYPLVKKMLASFNGQVKLVLRYATFHKGSEEIVRLLEASRLQGVYEPVLEILLEKQPEWAIHGHPKLDKAWAFAESAGLNVDAARKVMFSDEINQILAQEKEDIKMLKVSRTPTFFVNGKALPSFGVPQLFDLVNAEAKAARAAAKP